MPGRLSRLTLINGAGGLAWWWGTADIGIGLGAAMFGFCVGWFGPSVTKHGAGRVLPVAAFGLLSWLLKRYGPFRP